MCTVVNIFQVYSIWRLGITSFTQTDGITFYRLESPVYSKKMQWSNNTPYFLTERIDTYEVDHIFNPAVIHDNFMIWKCFPFVSVIRRSLVDFLENGQQYEALLTWASY